MENTTPQDRDAEPDKQVRRWENIIVRASTDEGLRNKRIRRWRNYAAFACAKGSDQELADLYDEGDESDNTSKPNLLYSTLVSLLPLTAAKIPEVAITPSEAVDPSMYELMRGYARTAEIVVNEALRRGRFKKKLRRNCMSAFVTALGWLKVSYQRDYRRDAMIQGRIDDTQNNIAEIQRLIAETDPEARDIDPDDREVKLQLLQQQASALEQRVEVLVAQGFVFDRVLSEDLLVDPNIEEMDDYREAGWIAHGSDITIEEAKRRFRLQGEEWERELSNATVQRRMQRGNSRHNQVSPIIVPAGTQRPVKDDTVVRVWEIWDRISQTVYTHILGCKRWAKEPWVPTKQGAQWYPFFPLMFNEVDGKREPLSDVDQLSDLIDEYTETRSAFRDHRQKASPGLIGRKGDISKPDAEKINTRVTGELVLIDGPDDPQKPVSASFGPINYPQVDPGLYDTTPIRTDIEMISGLQDAARGSTIKPKTATEAQILEHGKSTRTGDRQDCVEEYTRDIAEYVLEVGMQEMSIVQVQRIAGPSAVWPQQIQGMPGQPLQYVVVDRTTQMQWSLTRDDLYLMVMVDVRAGSTGKPNKLQEQDNWMKIWPLLQQSVQQITMLKMQGMVDLADAQAELLKEMLRRWDERIDIERFLPNVRGVPGQQQPGLMQPAAQPGAQPDTQGAQGQPIAPGGALGANPLLAMMAAGGMQPGAGAGGQQAGMQPQGGQGGAAVPHAPPMMGQIH